MFSMYSIVQHRSPHSGYLHTYLMFMTEIHETFAAMIVSQEVVLIHFKTLQNFANLELLEM